MLVKEGPVTHNITTTKQNTQNYAHIPHDIFHYKYTQTRVVLMPILPVMAVF